ncbi:hypothetical protein HYPSUDRAFT_209854 [Hypholoma sublateritium FD-334 SS-4]|uniref:Uncharacterized protein n=1 Tax=Hypholoma sublateritium (strain FD-334 SS-4) TaxID=945553 RepID=A0A0D2N8N4_HYPSF|nr:hypothetical protein HYPSUDRAFT_209854 [Hypholoma sublateritium FD-334 SS-4]
MDETEYNQALARYEELLTTIRNRKAQIHRRLKYQHGKANGPAPRFASGDEDPMAILMSKLTGVSLVKPRRKTGFNVWGPAHTSILDHLVDERAEAENIVGRKKIGLRTKIYKEQYDELDAEEKEEWEAKAQEQYDAAMKRISDLLTLPASNEPEDRQKVISHIPSFAQPILDLIAEYSGWKVSLFAGGPEPADGGRLNTISVHSGTTCGQVKMTFGRAERKPIRDNVLPIFGSFLKKCWTVEECRGWALSSSTSSLAALAEANDGGVTFDLHSVDALTEIRIPAPPAAARPSADVHHSSLKTKAANVATYRLPLKIGPPIHSKKIAQKRRQSTAHQKNDLTPAMEVTPLIVYSRGPSPAPSIPNSRCSTPVPPSSHIISPEAPASTPQHESVNQTSTPRPPSPPETHPVATSTDIPVPAPHLSATPPPTTSDAVAKQNSEQSQKRSRGEDDVDATDVPSQGPSKRTRTSPRNSKDADGSGDDADDEASPEWFRKAISMLASKDLGGGWLALISAWRRFEKAAGYSEAAILSSEGRPPCVGAWISRARSPKYQPPLSEKNLEDLDHSFWTWWRTLQPHHRKDVDAEDGSMLLRNVGDMHTIRKPGKNGILSVLAALWFWGSARHLVSSGTLSSWAAAVDDVFWVIEQMTPPSSNTA